MFKFKSLTNVRPTRELGCKIICSPTYGQFKVTPEAATILDVDGNDYLQIVEADGNFYAVKGANGLGGKLSSTLKGGGGVLQFSSSAAWSELSNDLDVNKHFNLDVNDYQEQDGKKYFKLTFDIDVPKQSRKTKAKEEAAEVETEIETETTSLSDTQNDTVTQENNDPDEGGFEAM